MIGGAVSLVIWLGISAAFCWIWTLAVVEEKLIFLNVVEAFNVTLVSVVWSNSLLVVETAFWVLFNVLIEDIVSATLVMLVLIFCTSDKYVLIKEIIFSFSVLFPFTKSNTRNK